MQMIPYLLAFVFIVTGVIFLLARKYDSVKVFIEDIFLNNKDMFGEDVPYAPIQWWLGWPCVALGIIVLVPTPVLVNWAILGFIVYFVHKIQQDKKNKKNTVVQEATPYDPKN